MRVRRVPQVRGAGDLDAEPHALAERHPRRLRARAQDEGSDDAREIGWTCRCRRRPDPRATLNTASLSKYKQMVDAWGGWDLLQDLLLVLKGIADRHRVSIADVAIRYVLDRPAVAGVIVGVRLGVADHRDDNAQVFGVELGPADQDGIESVLGRSRDLYQIIGDCGDEYRR